MVCFKSDLPAQDLKAEKSLIGSLIVKNGLYENVSVTPEDFYSLANSRTFKTMLGMFSRGEPVDVVTIFDQLKKDHADGKVLTPNDLDRILEESPLFQIDSYCRIIKECSITRSVKNVCASIFSSEKVGNDILSDAQRDILSISSSTHQDDIKMIRDIINYHIDRIELANKTEVDNYLRFGFPNIDRCLKTNGPKLIVVAGRPGAGKTSFALTATKNIDRAGHKVGFLSIEMPEFEIIDRLLSMESYVNASKFGRYKGLDKTEIQMVSDAASALYESNIQLDSCGGVDITDVERKSRIMKKNGAEIIFIDQLSHIGNREINQGDLTTRYSENVTRLSALKKELGIPIVLLAQLNRDLKARSNKRPILSDLKQSGKIEEDADAVIFLHRPEEYAENETEIIELSGLAVIDIAKNRNGSKFTDKNIKFNHETTYFYQGVL